MRSRGTRLLVAIGSVLVAVALACGAIYIYHENSDNADKLTDILGTVLNLAAVAIAGAGLALSRRMGRSTNRRSTRQAVQGDDKSEIVARRAQRVTGKISGDIDQEIVARGSSQIDASDAQAIGPDNG
jgi:hypothetical protein